MRRHVFVLAAAIGAYCLLSGCGADILATAALEGGGLALASSANEANNASPQIVFDNASPSPLPAAKTVAVWPTDTSEQMFADKIATHFTVTMPDAVAPILASAGIKADLNHVTPADLDMGFKAICAKSHVGLVFADPTTSAQHGDLDAYSCTAHAIVWREAATVTGITSQNRAQALAMIAQAEANRVIAAEQIGVMQAMN